MAASEHPNSALVRAFHRAQGEFYGGGSAEPLFEFLSPEICWHVPGRNAIAGDYRGLDEVLGYFQKRREHADRTFRIEVRAVLANDEFVLQLADGTATLAGTSREWRTVGVFRIEGGKIAECWLVPFDQYSFDEIWS
jgi:uncharacterized protein